MAKEAQDQRNAARTARTEADARASLLAQRGSNPAKPEPEPEPEREPEPEPEPELGSGFTIPSLDRCAAALGDLSSCTAALHAACDCQRLDRFARISLPGTHDWLAEFAERESGQSVAEFEAASDWRAGPSRAQPSLALVPVGEFEDGRAPDVDHIVQYMRAFFQCDVRLLPPVTFDYSNALTDSNAREGSEGQLQLNCNPSRALQKRLRALRPKDSCFAIMGVTMVDLYPKSDWNFVYGLADPAKKAGVFSFARYDPSGEFSLRGGPEARKSGSVSAKTRRPKLTDTEHRELLRRCFRLISHEMCHVLGLRHCIYYSCLMNGVNNDEEMDRTPLHLCPICLRKLCSVPMLAGHGTAAVDVRLRYVDMHEVFTTHGMSEEAEWVELWLRDLRKLEVEIPGVGRQGKRAPLCPVFAAQHTVRGSQKRNSIKCA